jgi:peptidoglycan/LPS O-acetylase OafA/YrhL
MTRIRELDALRAIAGIWILGFHYCYGSGLLRDILGVGYGSLHFFFAITGFLLGTIVLAHAGDRGFLRIYLLRRALRICPPYYALILALGVFVALKPRFGSVAGLPYYLTLTQNIEGYWGAETHHLAYPAEATWLLAVTVQFSLLLGVLIAWLGVGWIAPVAVALAVGALVARFSEMPLNLLAARSDPFAFGLILAIAMARTARDPTRRHAVGGWLAVIAAGSFAYLTLGLVLMGGRPFAILNSPTRWLDYSVSALFFASVVGLVVRFQGHPLLAPLRWRWLCGIGTISYGLYLYHLAALLIGDRIAAGLGLSLGFSRWLVSPALTVVAAWVSWTLIEKPCLALKARFPYAPTPHRAGIDTPLLAPDARVESLPIARAGRDSPRIGVDPAGPSDALTPP